MPASQWTGRSSASLQLCGSAPGGSFFQYPLCAQCHSFRGKANRTARGKAGRWVLSYGHMVSYHELQASSGRLSAKQHSSSCLALASPMLGIGSITSTGTGRPQVGPGTAASHFPARCLSSLCLLWDAVVAFTMAAERQKVKTWESGTQATGSGP